MELKQKKGITLIALVVTIIVLIILAGVSISLILGDNGIITKAKIGKKDTEEAQIKEDVLMMLGECQIDNENKITIDDFQVWIGNNKSEISIIDNRPEKNTIDLYYKDKIVEISDELEIVDIREAGFKVKIDKKIENGKITISASVTSNTGDMTITSIKFGEEIKNGSEATFNLDYPGIYKVEVTLSDGKVVVATYNITEGNYDVVKYMMANSITASTLGFTEERGWYQADPGGIGLGVARWSGTGDLYGAFEITPDKLNVFNLNVENMRVTFALSADGNAWAGGSVYVYYSEDDYDVYYVDSVSWTANEQYFDRSADITFRDEPAQKIRFQINGWDGESAGSKAYVKSIILNPRGRTYLMYKGKAENKGIYGDLEVRNGEGGTASYENMYIRYQSNDTDAVAGAWIRTKGKLDITEYTTLNVEVYFGNRKHANSSINVKVLNSESTDEIVRQYARTDIQNGGYTMSVYLADLTDGSYPIEISLDGYEDLRIYNIWVE